MTEATTIQDQLETFRVKYPSINCTVYCDMIVYSCAKGWAKHSVKLAKEIIKREGLNLRAKETSSTSYVIEPLNS